MVIRRDRQEEDWAELNSDYWNGCRQGLDYYPTIYLLNKY